MNDPLWQQAEVIFHQARELPGGQREAFLDGACAGLPGLRQLVEQLLNAEPAAGRRFAGTAPLAALASDWERSQEPPPPGQRVGPWRIEHKVGSGGMGEVYLALRDDGAYEQRAAIKLLQRGFDTETACQRFLRERQILARLEHPSVARLLDGGISDEGRPYLAMEFIEGVPLDEFCQRGQLTLRERIQLFRQVCAAVEFAHVNLIVHRDLKPANVLVTPRGEAKLLDFGIAKLLDEQVNAEQTSQTQLMLTPRYASPEQISGEPVSTRSDVYALGVVLYELLTRRSPYASTQRTAAEWFRAVREEEPAPPSRTCEFAWRRDLEGDLDAIVMKALEKDPERRYASVEQFDADLRRQLTGQPVSARPPTALYRFSRFVRRHRTGVAAALLAAVALLGGLGAALWQARIARAERTVAERRFEQVRGLARLALFDLYDVVRDLPGGTQAQRLLIGKSLEHYERLAAEARGDVELLTEVAEGYARLGDLQGNPFTPNTGDTAEALETYRRGLALIEPAAGKDAPPNAILARANLIRKQGEVMAGAGQAERGVKHLRESLALMDGIAGRYLPAMEERCSTLGTLSDFLGGLATSKTLDYEGTSRGARESLDCWQALSERPNLPDATRGRANRALSIGEGKLAILAWAEDRFDDALKLLKSASARLARLPASEARTLTVRRLEVWLAQEHTEVLRDMGRPREALTAIGAGIAAARDLLAADPGNTQFEVSLLTNLYVAGSVALALEDPQSARKYYQESLDRQESLLRRDPGNESHLTRLEDLRKAMMELEKQ